MTAHRSSLDRLDPLRFVERVLTHADGTPLGQRLDSWQRQDFAVALRTTKHLWRELPRGHSKTQDAAAVALAMLTLGTPGQRIYLCATDTDQAALAFDSLRGFVRRSALLSNALRVLRREVVYEEHDSIVTVLSADAASSWGLRPSLVVADEVAQWRTPAHEEFFWSLWSALGKAEGARLLVCTTAHWDRAGLCWQVRERVHHDPAWHVSIRGQCASWIDPAFLEAQRRLLPAHLFEMLHENRWTEAGGEFLTWEEIEGVFDPGHAPRTEPMPGAIYLMGVDLATARDRTAVAVLRVEHGVVPRDPEPMPEGRRDLAFWSARIRGQAREENKPRPPARFVVDALALWQGSAKERVSLAEVEEVIVTLARRFIAALIVVDPYQAALMSQRLAGRHLPIREYPFTTQSRTQLFATLLDLIRQRRLQSFPHPVLREELAGLRWVEKAGILRPDHPTTGHDDAVVAVGLASLAALRASEYQPPEIVVEIL